MLKDKTVKNSASNLPIKQALQVQSEQLLPVITQVLLVLQYNKIVHQRISQQYIEARKNQTQEKNPQSIRQSSKQSYYEGLTRAHHLEYGSVMIKWRIFTHHIASNKNQWAPDLNHEISVLKALYASQKTQSTTITPPMLADHDVEIYVSGQSHRLTVLVTPYYINDSLVRQLNGQQHSSLTDKQKYHFIVQSAQLILSLHKAGWLHNDIKPSNFLLVNNLTGNADGDHTAPDLLMTDFALAGKIDKLRSTNSTGGTPAYLAPERWQGQRATMQSDIYAFGIMMYEILMGKRPFNIDLQSNQSMTDWAIQHCQQSIPKLPIEYAHYQSILDKSLAKRVEKRYQSMDVILEGLRFEALAVNRK